MLLKTKLTNQIKAEAEKYHMSVIINLKNIKVNGQNRGCCGHITNVYSGGCVYVNTEISCYAYLAGKSLCRYALNDKDYSSNGLINGNNHFYDNDEFAKYVVAFLYEGIQHPKEKK